MGWTAPATVSAGQLMTAAFWNTHVRDNELALYANTIGAILKANSGTDASAGATTVDSIAITGLTAKDTLAIEVTLESVTQLTTAPSLYHVTDALAIQLLLNTGGDLAAGQVHVGTAKIRQRQNATTKIASYNIGGNNSLGSVGGNTYNFITTTTAWTGAWTLGLRHGGVVAGGTLQWAWIVYKVAGQ